jgi:hypothetical protein
MDKSKLWLLAACVALGGVIAWQRPFDVAAPARVPATAMSKPAAPATRAVPASRAAAGETPDDYVYVPPSKPRPKAVVETTPTRRVTTTAAATAAPSYERSVAEATAVATEDLDRAARRLELLIAEEPARPDAYQKLAAIRLQQGDYHQASQMFASALRHGGTAAFAILHDHTRGNFDTGANDTCAGELAIAQAGVRFEGAAGHRFDVSWAELMEAGANRFFGSGIGGFHVKVAAPQGKTRNLNLAPRSRDKREANLILDLLIDHAKRPEPGQNR